MHSKILINLSKSLFNLFSTFLNITAASTLFVIIIIGVSCNWDLELIRKNFFLLTNEELKHFIAICFFASFLIITPLRYLFRIPTNEQFDNSQIELMESNSKLLSKLNLANEKIFELETQVEEYERKYII